MTSSGSPRISTPERVEAACGIPADELRRMARELAAADRAAVYGRIGTTVQEFGTLASWLVDVLNVLSGSFDKPGGAVFVKAAAAQRNSVGQPGRGRGVVSARWGSRVRGLPEVLGELPVSALAEEIDTPGEGQVRALVTVAGNPLVSTPNAARLGSAVEGLEFMVSVDIYLNETTRHADVVLPSPDPLARSHYDLALYQFAARNVANYSPSVLEREKGLIEESEIFLRLTGIVTGQGADCDPDAIDDAVIGALVGREIGTAGGAIEGRDAGEIIAALEPRRGADRVLDLLIRTGAYGDGFGADSDGLTLDRLEDEPHGIDLEPTSRAFPTSLALARGRSTRAEAVIADVPRLRERLDQGAWNGSGPQMVLIGRRQLRSNNSWMHNLNALVKGKDRCTRGAVRRRPARPSGCGASAHRPARAVRARSAWSALATGCGAHLVAALAVELPALARRGLACVVGADDLGEPLEAAEERRRLGCRLTSTPPGPRARACRRSDRRLARERAGEPAMRQERSAGCSPQQAVERIGGRGVGREHAHAAVRCLRLGDDARRDVERVADACRSRSSSSVSAHVPASGGDLLRQQPRRRATAPAGPSRPSPCRPPRDARDVEMRPVELPRELRQEARGGDASARATRDVGEVREVAREALVVVVPQRQRPSAVVGLVARRDQRARQRVVVAEDAARDVTERDRPSRR